MLNIMMCVLCQLAHNPINAVGALLLLRELMELNHSGIIYLDLGVSE